MTLPLHPPLLPHYIACAIMAAISVPLILKRIPPNRFYGVRTAKTLNDTAVWYKINYFGGWAILIAALVGAVNLALLTQYPLVWSVNAGLLVVTPVVVAVVITWLYSLRV